MRWLWLPVLWIVALCLVFVVLWRMWRGKNVILRGKWSPRIIRMVAILLVIFGVGADKKANAAPIPKLPVKNTEDASLPKYVTTDAIAIWIQNHQRSSPWVVFKQAYTLVEQQGEKSDKALMQQMERGLTRVPPKARAILQAQGEATAKGQPMPKFAPADVLAAIEQVEQMGHFDHWLIARLWETTTRNFDGNEQKTIEVFARLHHHARVTDTLIRAFGQIKPIGLGPRAWASKGGPSIAIRQQLALAPAQILGAAKVLHQKSDPGTWQRDGMIQFRLAKTSAPCVVHRGGKEIRLQPGEAQKFGRLDVLETAKGNGELVLVHDLLGEIRLSADELITAWNLPQHLSKDMTQRIEQLVLKAIEGDGTSADLLEKMLPLTHQAIRIELKERPQARGSAKMRLVLALFDDAVMPRLTFTPPKSGFGRGGFGGRREGGRR